MNIHVFGAALGIGKWFVEHAFALEQKIFAYDVNARILEDFADSSADITPIQLDAANQKNPPFSPAHFRPNDWVLLAVPEAELGNLCRALRGLLPESIGVAIMTSRQDEPIALATKLLPQAFVFGLHPLFGSHLTSAYGQTVAICALDARPRATAPLEAALIESGLRFIRKHPAEHDQSMAYIQALTHFIFLSFSSVLSSSDKKIEHLMAMRTPPFQFLMAFSSRMLMQSPDTFAAIQSSEEHSRVRGEFLEVVQELHRLFLHNDAAQAAKKIQSIKEGFSISMLEEWMHYSELAVASLQAREKSFIEKCKERTAVVFRTRGTPRCRVGIIDRVLDFSLELTEFMTRIELSGETRIPCPVNAVATEAYRKNGINAKTQNALMVKKENLELLSSVDAAAWLKDNMLPIQHIHTFENPMAMSEAFMAAWLPKVCPAVWRCECIDTHKSAATLSLTLDPSVPVSATEKSIQAFLSGAVSA